LTLQSHLVWQPHSVVPASETGTRLDIQLIRLRKIIKTRGSFPSEEAAMKLLNLALRNVAVKWDALQHWRQAMNHFQML
jgi:transposase-like protein